MILIMKSLVHGLQATKAATGAKAKSPGADRAAGGKGKAGDGAHKNGEIENGDAKSSIPEVANVLEFVAWLVGTGRAASAPQSAWLNGRGGFLADELPAVREASIRIQVRTKWPPSFCFPFYGAVKTTVCPSGSHI
jgi:hypothetical protein